MYYTKYRPQKFSEIIKPNAVIDALVQQVKTEKLAHSYLFVGSRGTGKTTTARILAKAANCLDICTNGDPCGVCANCVEITKGSFADLIEIDAASNRGIDDIRELKSKVKLSPVIGRKKVYIVDEVHMLTTEAFNALLKTLEEPPVHVIFILCTTELHKVPDTIKSRCQVYKFKRATSAQIINKLKSIASLEEANLDEAVFSFIADASFGAYRDAETMLQQVIEGSLDHSLVGSSLDTTYVSFVQGLLVEDSALIATLFRSLDEDGVDFKAWSGGLLSFLRTLLYVASAPSMAEDVFYNEALRTSAQKLVEMGSASVFISLLERFSHAHSQIDSAVLPQIPLELAAFGYLARNQNPTNTKAVKPNKGSPSPLEKKAVGDSEDKGAETAMYEQAFLDDDDTPVTEVSADVVASRSQSISLADVSLKWEQIVATTVSHNSSIKALLKSSELVGVEEDFLIIEVLYEFHKERLETQKNRTVVETVVKEILGIPMRIKCVINPTKRPVKRLAERESGELTDYNVVPAFSLNNEEMLKNLNNVLDGGLPL